MPSATPSSSAKATTLEELGGTSGCLIASRLAAETEPKQRVLLVEAGGEAEEDPDNLVPGLTKSKFGNPTGNWAYTTAAQKDLNGRLIPYPRGLGLGGSSAVGDPWWRWETVLPVMKKFENFKPECPLGEEKYISPAPGAHGEGGPISVGHPPEWQPLIKHCLVAGEEVGHSINPDHNSGDAEGLAVAQFNVGEGARTTSVTAFLHPGARSKLGNLTVVTRALGARILFEGKKAVGMELIPATGDVSSSQISVFASKEVILTAGTFASPQLLLLSGVGPANDLARMGIPLVHDLPAVGQNMQDHSAVACEIVIDKSIAGHNQLLNDPDALNAAHKQYKESKTGPLAMFGASAAVIFPHLPSLYTTRAFHDLPASTQEFLTAPGRPSTEIWTHGGPLFYQGPCPPDASVLCLEGLCQNNLSRGTVKLASRNPRDLPIIDPKYLSHPFDLHIALETLKELLKLANSPALSRITESILHGPRNPNDKTKLASSSDEDILEAFIRETMVMGFHAMSTCVMGSPEQKDKVVGNDFRVDGIEGLRVADLSVCPILTTNHTQINAYLIGERCADLVLGKA